MRKRLIYVRQAPRRSSSLKAKVRNAIRGRYLQGQDGFFRGALHSFFDVEEVSLPHILRKPGTFQTTADALAVNLNCRSDGRAATYEDLIGLSTIDLPKILAVTNARPESLPEDRTLDLFDLVFRRELLKDREYYAISPDNREKLHPTVISCPLVPATVSNVRHLRTPDTGFRSPASQHDFDVSFSGASTSIERVRLPTTLEMAGIRGNFVIQPRQHEDLIPQHMRSPPLSRTDYSQLMRRTRVNLALSGYGPFTYRHLEAWCLCTFAISTPGIRDLELPFDVKEGTHYVAFDDDDDLVDKCRHYLEHEQQRNEIAEAGRRLFETEYSFGKHGAWVASLI